MGQKKRGIATKDRGSAITSYLYQKKYKKYLSVIARRLKGPGAEKKEKQRVSQYPSGGV